MGISNFFHAVLNHLLSWIHLAENREYGWKTVDRTTGRLTREQQPLLKKLKLLLLFNPVTEWLDTTHLMRRYIHNKSVREGRTEVTLASRNKIQRFVETYNISMDDFTPSDISQYSTFEDFFIRHHAPGSRPIYKPDEPSSAVVVADSRVVVYETVSETKQLWIKGHNFSIASLVMDTALGSQFRDGAIASFRLSPQDYHRYHSPVTGRIKLFRSVPGDYYQVDPVALNSDVDILTRNARGYLVIETESFHDVLFVAIGATNVGTVDFQKKWQEPGAEVKKGDELGLFQFGGSSIIVAFQKGRVEFDEDLGDLSRQRIQVSVQVGVSLGSAKP
ncbi:phosphatidylserine decarboxylase [Ilyonectria sp. MPI-CAGE-AT-0026]|nr:phosphatidylserine decarboxylase [Ilyonectria sp. MPI-CAGE-AT-0026]